MSMERNLDSLYDEVVELSNVQPLNGNTLDTILTRLTAIETRLAQLSSETEKAIIEPPTNTTDNSERSESENTESEVNENAQN